MSHLKPQHHKSNHEYSGDIIIDGKVIGFRNVSYPTIGIFIIRYQHFKSVIEKMGKDGDPETSAPVIQVTKSDGENKSRDELMEIEMHEAEQRGGDDDACVDITGPVFKEGL